jgi:hypothetical protein
VGKPRQLGGTTRRVAIVVSHFIPSNLAAVHRARLWSLHLRDFGWEPLIVTTDWRYYEEPPDFELCDLLPPDITVIRTRALPSKPIRVIGDTGLRALLWHWFALKNLVRQHAIDFVHITVPSNYSALLGPLLHRAHVPFGIDYIDPWLHESDLGERVLSKAWLTQRLGSVLEPFAVRHARLITGITSGYYSGVLRRNPHLAKQAVVDCMPYGAEMSDFQRAAQTRLKDPLWEEDGRFHAIYAGALLPKALEPLVAFFRALRTILDKNPQWHRLFQMHFVGTGSRPADARSYRVLPIAEKLGVESLVTERPERMPYLQVLAHLTRASGVLILGSTEAHYSPSKTFQAIQSDKPILALLHFRSTAVEYLRSAGGAEVVTLSDEASVDTEHLSRAVHDWVNGKLQIPNGRARSIPEEQTARGSARKLAMALQAAIR